MFEAQPLDFGAAMDTNEEDATRSSPQPLQAPSRARESILYRVEIITPRPSRVQAEMRLPRRAVASTDRVSFTHFVDLM